MSKYEALGQFLKTQEAQLVPMTFAQIEQVIGAVLPPSAHKYRPWWSNNGSNSALTRVWLDAGFKSEQVDMEGQRVVFRRTNNRSARAAAGHPLRGALKGTVIIPKDTDLTQPADPDWGKDY